MRVNQVRNVNEALAAGLRLLSSGLAVRKASRNGPVSSADCPVVTQTFCPMERVLFSPYRDANPFFHFMESMWMLAGRNDLGWLTQYNKQMEAYSDDGGVTQPAAYGHRWREFFQYDQLDAIVNLMRKEPSTRRAVLAMWHPGDADPYAFETGSDLDGALNGSKDVPCNTHVYFILRPGGVEDDTDGFRKQAPPTLDMTVCCRSNDILWGAHGANAVHFSVLMEYIAAKLGVQMGIMYQISNDYHLYDGILKYPPEVVANDCETNNHYTEMRGLVTPLFHHKDVLGFDAELPGFMQYASSDGGFAVFEHRTFNHIGVPMVEAWRAYKRKDFSSAMHYSSQIADGDWQIACAAWIERRIK